MELQASDVFFHSTFLIVIMQPDSPFEGLTPELLIPIMTYLPDLESPDNLLKASPAAFHIFDIYGAEILKAVLSSGVIHEYTCALIRIVAAVRSSCLPPSVCDLTSFQSLILHESTSHRYEPPWTLTSSKFLSAVPATVLRGILATYRKIICLTISCLKFYLNRFQPLKPSHLVDKAFRFTSEYYGPDRHYIPSWQQKPAEQPFPVHDIGGPTWVEEQRVLRAFWRVQVIHDLRTAVKASLISWPENDVSMLDEKTVAILNDVPWKGLLNLEDIEAGVEPYMYYPLKLLEQELIWSVEYYVKMDRQVIIAPDFLKTKRDWPTPTAKGQQNLETISDFSSFIYDFFDEVSGSPGSYDVTGNCSPLQQIPFESFRNFGFAIWDIERMVGYGFISTKFCYSDHSYLLAWRSILGRDEIAELERNNQKMYKWATNTESDKGESDDDSE